MKRRNFLQSVPITLGGMSLSAYANSPLLSDLACNFMDTDKVLVIIQLNGGNDGLNTVIPLDQYAVLSQPNIRQNILIPENKVLKLPGTNDSLGFHPSLSGIHNLYKENKVAIVQNVGYPQFSYSHFRAADIWVSGADYNEVLNSGWAARYLASEFPNYPSGFPNMSFPDPLAIRVGGTITLGLQNQGVSMGIAINNAKDPLNLSGNLFTDPPTPGCLGKELSYAREVLRQTDKFGDAVQAAGDKGRNLSSLYPVANTPGAVLGSQLALVAKLIDGGCKTRIYWLSTGGFDTHSSQVESADHTAGVHSGLLKGVSDAIAAFMDDLTLLGRADRVMGMTFSEFGRRIISNASGGTDHGAAQPVLIFGSHVIPGVYGHNPVIDPLSNVNSNLPMEFDFRSVYATILADWFCVGSADRDNILLKKYQNIGFLNPNNCLMTGVKSNQRYAGAKLIEAYPNPCADQVRIAFESEGGMVIIELLNQEGRLVQTVFNGYLESGHFDIACSMQKIPEGIYYLRIQNSVSEQVRKLIKARL
ncbi:MAG: DUF1501 domain-containing protein [Saprospiraceae bacterium]